MGCIYEYYKLPVIVKKYNLKKLGTSTPFSIRPLQNYFVFCVDFNFDRLFVKSKGGQFQFQQQLDDNLKQMK